MAVFLLVLTVIVLSPTFLVLVCCLSLAFNRSHNPAWEAAESKRIEEDWQEQEQEQDLQNMQLRKVR